MWKTKMTMLFLISTILLTKYSMPLLSLTLIMCMALSMNMFLNTMNHWSAILLVMLYVTGIMILFMYIVSLTPNEKSMKNKMKNLMTTMLLMITTYYMNTPSNMMTSKSLKMNTAFNTTAYSIILATLMIFTTAYMPTKLLIKMYKGMKSSN